MNRRVCGLVYSRMSSQRLPGKALRKIAGKELLLHVVERASIYIARRDIVVATSTDILDDQIAYFCAKHDIRCLRGDLDNVAARTECILNQVNCDFFFRICGDRPVQCIDSGLKALQVVKEDGTVDLVTNLRESGNIPGLTTELISSSAMLSVCKKQLDSYEQEHITQYFYRNQEQFAIKYLDAEKVHERYKGESFVVDTIDDLKKIEVVLSDENAESWFRV